MKKILLLYVFIFLSPKIAAQARIEFFPDTVIQNSKDTITVSVKITGAVDLYASSICIRYDKNIVRAVGFLEGTFMENNSRHNPVHYEVYPDYSTAADTIIVDQSILGISGASGSGILFSIKFLPLAAGKTNIIVNSIKLRDSNNNPIPVTADTGYITILGSQIKAKAFLEGPFNGTDMNCSLLSSLPYAQPYSSSPWNYLGDEAVNSSFYSSHTNIVDWVLLELRTGIAASSTIEKRAAFITKTGDIVDTDGFSPVNFSSIINQDCYLVLKHRNHLSIMSASKLSFTASPVIFDFTVSQSRAYGSNSMAVLTGGLFGLAAGDNNTDKFIDLSDYIKVDNEMFQTGYKISDVNMDGFIDLSDFVIIDNNMFHESNVPN
jgi:hypothetical protein